MAATNALITVLITVTLIILSIVPVSNLRIPTMLARPKPQAYPKMTRPQIPYRRNYETIFPSIHRSLAVPESPKITEPQILNRRKYGQIFPSYTSHRLMAVHAPVPIGITRSSYDGSHYKSTNFNSLFERPPTENPNCVLIEFGQLQFDWTYTTVDNKTASDLFNITSTPTDQKSVCNKLNQSFTINYGKRASIQFRFEAKESEYTLTGIDLKFNATEDFKDAKASDKFEKLLYHSTDKIVTPIGKSNSCIKEEFLSFNSTPIDSIEVKSINVSITNLRFEAFLTNNSKEFSPSQDCHKIEEEEKVEPTKAGPKAEPNAEPNAGPKAGSKAEPQIKGSAVAIYIVTSLFAVVAITLIGFLVSVNIFRLVTIKAAKKYEKGT